MCWQKAPGKHIHHYNSLLKDSKITDWFALQEV